MTFGSGVHGSLGHGNHNDVVQAKIVEALIGFEVEQVRTGEMREVGGWGDGTGSPVHWIYILYNHVILTIH